jgi:hypothetical protein
MHIGFSTKTCAPPARDVRLRRGQHLVERRERGRRAPTLRQALGAEWIDVGDADELDARHA